MDAPDGTEIGTSPIAGRGLFATTDLAGGSVLPALVLAALNHSCDPNLGWTAEGDLVTLHDVGAGEELAVDYATSTVDPDFYLRCHCGSPRCRQMVEGSDWRIPQLQQRYAGHWRPDVQRLLDHEAS